MFFGGQEQLTSLYVREGTRLWHGFRRASGSAATLPQAFLYGLRKFVVFETKLLYLGEQCCEGVVAPYASLGSW